MKWHSVSNMGKIKENIVTNGAKWCPVNYGDSPKGAFFNQVKNQKKEIIKAYRDMNFIFF